MRIEESIEGNGPHGMVLNPTDDAELILNCHGKDDTIPLLTRWFVPPIMWILLPLPPLCPSYLLLRKRRRRKKDYSHEWTIIDAVNIFC